MALIKCPECGKEISDKAGACPHCGCPIGSTGQQVESNSVKKVMETKKLLLVV